MCRWSATGPSVSRPLPAPAAQPGLTALPELRLHGMIVSGQAGAALLSINQQPVRAYRPGQELAPGVLLDSLQREHIVITVDAVPQQIATERKGPAIIPGIQQGAQP